MSRILKAPYVIIEKNNYFSIDNTLKNLYNEENSREIQENEESLNQGKALEDKESILQMEEMLEDMKNDILKSAKNQADEIIENAKKEAKKIINQANLKIEEANKIYKEQKEQGFKKGFEKGEEEIENIKKEAYEIIENAKAEKEIIQKEIEPELIELVIEISQNVLTNAFKINPEIISLLIKKGLNNIKNIENIKINLSENQYEFVSNNKQEILGIDTDKNNIEIVKDLFLEDNDCIIETQIGTIKCGVNDQFQGVKEALQHILGYKN